MGVEEQVGEVSSKAISVMGERPLMLGILLLTVIALGFTTWQNHDNEQTHQDTLIKVLEYRHNEMLAMLDKMCEVDTALITPTPTSPSVTKFHGVKNED